MEPFVKSGNRCQHGHPLVCQFVLTTDRVTGRQVKRTRIVCETCEPNTASPQSAGQVPSANVEQIPEPLF